MTDKQMPNERRQYEYKSVYLEKSIIIDGVDVSGCEWIREVGLDSEYICTCNSPNKTSGYCKDNANCRYKQLLRKEQECERLKKYLNQIRDEELSHLDIEWDEYETSTRQEDYSNIITLVERALGEIDD